MLGFDNCNYNILSITCQTPTGWYTALVLSRSITAILETFSHSTWIWGLENIGFRRGNLHSPPSPLEDHIQIRWNIHPLSSLLSLPSSIQKRFIKSLSFCISCSFWLLKGPLKPKMVYYVIDNIQYFCLISLIFESEWLW